MIEQAQNGESVVLVHVDFSSKPSADIKAEFQALATAAGASIKQLITGRSDRPEPKWFVGRGKGEEIRQAVLDNQADLVIFNHCLTPAQERNLERLLQCRVLDRTGLILDIFAMRALTFEGKLQVELAQLEHLRTRLVRGWTHLVQQQGGIGFRGPGETQLETDRRLIRQRIRIIQKRLSHVQARRAHSRRARKQAQVPVLALIGYTNVGKSTLFNWLTDSQSFVGDQLFATLDPTLRAVTLAGIGRVILVDTVGFIRDLPHDLVEAFKATLEETRSADLLLHVCDASDPLRDEKRRAVNDVLVQIGAAHIPQLEIFNKIDACAEVIIPRIETTSFDKSRVWLSAIKQQGQAMLNEAIVRQLKEDVIQAWISVPVQDGDLRAALYDKKAVKAEQEKEGGGWDLFISLRRLEYDTLIKKTHRRDDKC